MTHLSIDKFITFIYTTDLQKSAEFYENQIGLQLWRDQGTCRIYHISAQGYLGICQTNGDSKGKVEDVQQDNIILTLITEHVDEWYKTLTTNGVKFEHPPSANPKFNIYHCFLRDPNGYLIEIQRFLDTK